MKKIILFVFLVAVFLLKIDYVFSATANITQINFTTKEQSIEPGVISKVFTVQTQNSAGQMEVIDETADLTLSVDSATGQFNSNNTTWDPDTVLTMSKGTGNKNFYYKDTTDGYFTITANIRTRTTGKSWEVKQKIFVGEVIIIDPGPATSTQATSTNPGSGSSATSSNAVSTHYVQEIISVYVEPTVFELTAGRDRLGYLGSPLEFRVKTKLSGDLRNSRCNYLWSFGDGAFDKGDQALHIYEEVGEYNLIVNGECEDFYAVDRLRVSILKPDLSITLLPENKVKVINNLNSEFNLYQTKLVSGRDEFDFPQDTIIDGWGEIIFSNKVLGFGNYSDVKLIDYSEKVLAEANQVAGVIYQIEPEELIKTIDYLKSLNLL